MLAPRVVSPPCDRNSACNSSATLVTRTVSWGPIRIAARPVPQGCEQLPAVGTGIGMQEITKTAAPIKATMGLKTGVTLLRLRRSRRPQATKGMATTNQNAAHGAGRIPSDKCMADAGKTQTKINTTESNIHFFMIGPLPLLPLSSPL